MEEEEGKEDDEERERERERGKAIRFFFQVTDFFAGFSNDHLLCADTYFFVKFVRV